MNSLSKKAAEKMFGAIILQPQLANCIPPAIHAELSPYGLFILKACSEGWGIEGIKHALESFGLDGHGIVDSAMKSVHGDPVSTFWLATRHLCRAVTS